ncbi:MAG: hypothetical protein PVF83_06675 [Anaerolineales bacterium]|jgi:hypothetical protein
MTCSQIVNSIGLILDIIGGVMLFLYGLAPRIDPEGRSYLFLNGYDNEEEKKKYKHYKLLSNIGIWLVIGGFIFQLIANFL